MIDELDTAIIKRLQADGRSTNREVAAALGVAPSTCLERTRRLQEAGVIAGVHAEIDLSALNRRVEALIAVKLRPQSRAVIDGFRRFVTDLPEAVALYITAGESGVLIHVAVQGTTQLQDFVLDRLTKHPEIASVTTSVIYQHVRNHVLTPLPSPSER
ncbi:MAG TPA: Lrp/AsnC family transcriptional regulator [Mycobacteriales bacterium]|jgi:DNA-binding Lrp family transcriptional regulator|nr:Lrp/AsnC family transcriptional regulator [Mycobacteriales bacterium]